MLINFCQIFIPPAFDTQHVEIGSKMVEIAKRQHPFAELVPIIPQTPQPDLTRLRNQHGRTHTRKHTHAGKRFIYKDVEWIADIHCLNSCHSRLSDNEE